MIDLTGQMIGRYRITGKVGEGGMAVVYKAIDTHLDSEVAVKVINTDQLPPAVLERTLKRFEREAKDVARITHPNIVKVMDYGQQDGIPYLVMPYLPGGTLRQYLTRHGRMNWKEAARLLMPIANALGHAHQARLVHRDVKPSNILLTSSFVPMLTDFGVAKVLTDEVTLDLTGTNTTVGTPAYMAPEQVVSKSVDYRADIYALGVVYYEMITGRCPFQGDTPMSVLLKHSSEPLTSPRKLVPDLPADVEAFLFKVLAKKPEERYTSMAEMEDGFNRLVSGLPLGITPGRQGVDSGATILNYDQRTVAQRGAVLTQYQPFPAGRIAPPQQPVYANESFLKKKKPGFLPWLIAGIVVVLGGALLLLLINKDEPGGTRITAQQAAELTSAALPGESGLPQDTPVPPQGQTGSSNSAQVSNQPTRQLSPTRYSPSPTITPTPVKCPGMPVSRVKVGDKAKVCTKEDRLKIRETPDIAGLIIRYIDTGTEFEIIGGPVCEDESTWWEIKTEVNKVIYSGWVREGTSVEEPYYICKLP